MIENLIEFISKSLCKNIAQHIGFLISAVVAYLICFTGDFRFFEALDVYFINRHIDYTMSALVIAAGSGFLQRKFDLINTIPNLLTGIQISSAKNRKRKKDIEESIKHDENWEDFY